MSDPDDDRKKLIGNERAKLTATFLNGVAVALIAVGALAPSLAPKPPVPPSDAALTIQALTSLSCLIGGLSLHLIARLFLRGLR